MEDSHYSHTKDTEHFEKTISLDFNPSKEVCSFLKKNGYSLTNKNNRFQFIVNKSDSGFKISNNNNSYHIQERNLPSSLLLLEKTFPRNYVQKNKPISYTRGEKREHFFLQLNAIAKDSIDLEDFCSKLQKIDFVSNYSLLNLIVQAKGEVSSTSFEFSKAITRSKKFKVSEFNRLFSAIKKSKNRSFGQSVLKSDTFEILGTCLAKEFSLDEYNIIFILSNNDFLPQEKKDIQAFNQFCQSIAFFFNFFLKLNYLKQQTTLNKEIIELNGKINHIKDRNFNIFDIRHKERISLLGELLNTLKHELSNPLFGLQLSAQLLPVEKFSDDSKELAQEIVAAIQRCHNIMASFSEIYTEKSTLEDINIIKLIKEVMTLTKSKTKGILIQLKLNRSPVTDTSTVILSSNKTLLAQVIFNLIINSCQALEDHHSKDTPQIFIDIETSQSQNLLHIQFADNGPGLKKSESHLVFSPFFTTKKDGTGLGLSICRNIMHKLNATIENLPSDNGAIFLLELPYENTCH